MGAFNNQLDLTFHEAQEDIISTMIRIVSRLTLLIGLEGVGFANLQITVLGLNKALAMTDKEHKGKHSDYMTLLSIIAGLLSLTYSLTKAILNMRCLNTRVQTHLATPAVWDPHLLSMARALMLAFYVIVILIVVLIAYAVVKLVHVVCVCDYGVWNLLGCVDVSEVLHSLGKAV